MKIKSNLIDIHNNKIYPAEIEFENSKIINIKKINEKPQTYILPGFIDAHVHIESSMAAPSAFAYEAVKHGTVATVSDPHEIANVLGKQGLDFMLNSAKKINFKFFFGVPSCVPATDFETSGAKLTASDVEALLQQNDFLYLSEMMNYPGVIFNDPEVHKKLSAAKKFNKPIDGHAPGLSGENLKKYIQAGISTDHECSSLKEAEEKIKLGMNILIREGSAAKNFNNLIPLLNKYPEKIMFCSDDLHPDDLINGHINLLVKRALKNNYNLFDILRAVSLNPVKFYKLNVGLLQINDPADFIIIDNLNNFNILQTFINGKKTFDKGNSKIPKINEKSINKFFINNIEKKDIQIKAISTKIKVINAFDGELLTKKTIEKAKIENNLIACDTNKDILKLIALNRYQQAKPAIAFIHGFNLKKGAIGSSIAHDSHNIIAVGTNDNDLIETIKIIQQNKGALVAVNGNDKTVLPLDIAGIISSQSVKQTALLYKKLNLKAKEFGTNLRAPFMTLAFMSLLVIPELKLGDKGLFDGKNFKFTDLFI
jgi:adenine deaminase